MSVIESKNALNEGSNHDTTIRLIEAAYQVAKCSEVLKWTQHIRPTYTSFLSLMLLVLAILVMLNLSILTKIAMTWVANEQEHTYTWFLNTLKKTIYDIFSCSPEVFVSDRDLASSLKGSK